MRFHSSNTTLNLIDLDDTASISSTVSVELNEKTFAQSPENKERKRVQFDETLNKEYANTQNCSEECQEFWFSAQNYQEFKSSSVYMAKEIAKAELESKTPFSYCQVVNRVYEACCQQEVDTETSVLTTFEQKQLNRWLDVATSRLGLERSAVRSIAKDKYRRRHEIVDIVLDLQEIRHNAPEDKEQYIRETCEHISLASRLFARTIAQAQAAVALSQEFFDC